MEDMEGKEIEVARMGIPILIDFRYYILIICIIKIGILLLIKTDIDYIYDIDFINENRFAYENRFKIGVYIFVCVLVFNRVKIIFYF